MSSSARAARLLAIVVLGIAGVLAGACSRPSPSDCEAAVRNWFTLVYWDEAEKEIAAAPPAERDALRKAKADDKDQKLASGLDLAIRQCRSARDHDGVKCMKAATTGAQARACREPKSP
jgi:hypothetical protein